ncbi:hypothetical protein SKAU_G00395510 [Synaphobranchus kaupii]|uniref:Sperm-associated antigen 5 n=1 Tax=Synaphobranchus kaupii TaxID=118154 RepID=A0A9Q1IC05_SYNKA|nr:hypothetical protein SKAU_G00395510 [Synaphobranchus kaupii]
MMATRRGFQAENGDSTPVMRPAERLPLRNLQNELLGQQLVLSATKPMSKAALKKKGEVVLVKVLSPCSPLRSTPASVAPLEETENGAAVAAAEDNSTFLKGCPDSLVAVVIDKELEPQSRTSCGTVRVQSERVAGTALTARAGEWADTVSARTQWASAGCLSDSSNRRVTQTATEDSAVEHCGGNVTGDVTFKSFLCSGVELEIADVSALSEQTIPLLAECTADVSSCCSFQNNLSDHQSLFQPSDPNSSNRHEDHPYCSPEREDSCSRDGPFPNGSPVVETPDCKDPLYGMDHTGQALLWSSKCLENMQGGSPSHLLHESGMFSYSSVEHDSAVQSLTADQSRSTPEKSLTADQSQDTAENGLTADQSQDTAVKSLTADQSQDTAEKSLTADQSQDAAVKSLTADQSQDTAEKSLTADQSQDTAEKCLTADQSQDTAEKCLTADQSQDTAEKCLTADQSQDTAEKSLTADQSQDTAVQGLAAERKVCETCTVLQTGACDVISGHPRERRSEGPSSCVEAGSPAVARGSQLREPGHGCPWDPADSPLGPREGRLWMGALDSPMPLPQLNSTLIHSILRSAILTPQTRKPGSGALPPPAEGGTGTLPGPLQEKLGPQAPGDLTGAQLGPLKENLGPQAPGDLTDSQTGLLQEMLGPQAAGGVTGAQSGPLQVRLRQMGELLLRASENLLPAVERHSASTWTSPVQVTEHAVNTSGLYERKREFSVTEASTSTDTLPWTLTPESLAGWTRQDLEQRLISTHIMVEALSQQLASAHAHKHHSAPPSDLRDTLVQTDHTELSQGTIYRELYVKAVEKIQALELEQDHQMRLLQELRNSRTTMSAVAAETEQALSSVNEMGKMASEDQVNISEQMCRMRALYGRFRTALRRMEEKMQLCSQEKRLTEQQMEEALKTQQASLLVLEQLRCRHAAQVAELEKSVGSHLELIPALSNACQEQVSLSEEYVESLQAADDLLKDAISDESRLYEELCKAQVLLQRTGPVLLKLHQKAAAALQARNQQQQETDQMRDELEQTSSCLHEARQQMGDLNLQITILTSEMAVLRQRLNEVEEERVQVEVRSTELSATLCSTQASCTFLQQALSTETHRLEEELGEATRRVEELGGALAERDHQLTQAHRRLQDLQKQLSSTHEINEFLQMESEVVREQVLQSEVLVKSHLQGLRERNLECEDLKQELCALRLQQDSLQEEVFSTQEKARAMLLDMGQQLALASTDITFLHHKVYTITCALNTTLNTQKPDRAPPTPAPPTPAPPHHLARSFVDSIMVAVTSEEAQTSETAVDEGQSTALGSENSAFSRVPTATPKKEVGDENKVQELLSGLGEAVSQLVYTADRVRDLRDGQHEALLHTISSLQEELDSQAAGHRSQVADLKEQVVLLQAQGEKDAVAHEQKTQELQREVSELQRSLQHAQLEVQVLKEELSSGQSAERLPALEEKVRLQTEVDKLKKTLNDTEDSRSELLRRAKRHKFVLEANKRKLERELHSLDQMIETVRQTLLSIPEVVKDCEQLEKLVAYLG